MSDKGRAGAETLTGDRMNGMRRGIDGAAMGRNENDRRHKVDIADPWPVTASRVVRRGQLAGDVTVRIAEH